jgi:hypothetical protein
MSSLNLVAPYSLFLQRLVLETLYLLYLYHVPLFIHSKNIKEDQYCEVLPYVSMKRQCYFHGHLNLMLSSSLGDCLTSELM